MIAMAQRPLPGTRTAENGCIWLARCEIDGRSFEARSRRGAAHELARLLVAAGIADQRVEARQAGLPGCIRYPSLHRMATRTFSEGDRPLRSVPSLPPEMAASGFEWGKSGGGTPEPVRPPPPNALVPEMEVADAL